MITQQTADLQQDNVLMVENQHYAEQVLASPIPVLVNFGAQWCPPCHALAPVYRKLSNDYTGQVRFVKMDIDMAPDIALQLNIRAVPTLVLFQNGQEVGRFVGPPPARLKRMLDELLEFLTRG